MTEAAKRAGYFIVSSGEDGICVSGPHTEVDVLARITPKDGTTYYGKLDGFHAEVPEQDSGHFCERGRRLLILRGEVVVPRTEEILVRYKL